MDRLITELNLTSEETYTRVRSIVEQVNVIMALLFRGDLMSTDARNYTESQNKTDNEAIDAEWVLNDKDDTHIYFSPTSNNVIFSSAIDGWAFSTQHFATLYAKKLGVSEEILKKCLWGDYYLCSQTKRIITPKQLKGNLQSNDI